MTPKWCFFAHCRHFHHHRCHDDAKREQRLQKTKQKPPHSTQGIFSLRVYNGFRLLFASAPRLSFLSLHTHIKPPRHGNQNSPHQFNPVPILLHQPPSHHSAATDLNYFQPPGSLFPKALCAQKLYNGAELVIL